MRDLILFFRNTNLVPIYSGLGIYFCFPPKRKIGKYNEHSLFLDMLDLVRSAKLFSEGPDNKYLGPVGHTVSIILFNFVIQKPPQTTGNKMALLGCAAIA